MATNTPNLNLVKPELTDNVNVGDFNSNFDTIDTEIGNLKNEYVSEFTTSGEWIVRKWNDGLVECFLTKEYSGLNFSTQKGSFFFQNPPLSVENLPIVFAAAPNIIATATPIGPTGDGKNDVMTEVFIPVVYSVTTNNFGVRICASRKYIPTKVGSTTPPVVVEVNYHVIGKVSAQ